MTNAELYQLVFQCLVNDDPKDIIAEIKNKVVLKEENLFRFIHLSSNHFVLPAIYIRLKDWGLTEYLPNDFIEHLDIIHTQNVKRNHEFLQQADEINRKLANEGIEPVYLKGTGNLLDDLYPNPGDRIIGDIDFLVQQKDFLKAAESIKSLGYKTEIKIYDPPETLKDYPRLTRDDVPAALEIHQMPVIPKYSKWLTTGQVFKEKKQIHTGVNCYVPSDKHKLIINFIHSQLSNKGHKLRNISIRDLYDSYLLLQRTSVNEAMGEINEKKKAQAYFDFIPLLLNNHQNSTISIDSKKFLKKHRWFLNHYKIHRYFIFIIKANDLIINRFFMAFANKTAFKNLIVRIKDKHWWKKRLSGGLREYFS